MEIVLAVVSVILIISVFLSLIRNDYWVFKILEYPRLQKLAIILIIIGCWSLYWPIRETVYQVIAAGLLLSFIYLLYKIWPYTALSKKEMLKVNSSDRDNEFKIFAANVLQDNTNYDALLSQISKNDPDMIFLLETNQGWADAVKPLAKDYPHSLLYPSENTYGLLFYSRFPLEDAKILFRVKKDIPSIDTKVVLPSGKKIQLWGLHPEPPVPGENLYSTAKDKELMKVALLARDCEMPHIVFGDLNDVAWSHTTELFRKTSRLLDPRRGRGFYSTFSAHSWFIRFPLDYIFCSKEFGLIDMRRMPKNGSDHFATCTILVLNNNLAENTAPSEADSGELHEAKEMASQPSA